jgi:hypothetical protein
MRFFKKYRLYIDIVGVIAFGFITWVQFEKYYSEEGKNTNLFFAIIGVLWVLFKSGDIVGYIRSSREKEQS